MMRVVFYIVLVLLPVSNVLAQYTTYESITELNGLSDNRVTCFKKDREGFMWIGTENGLNRYDGHEFIIYRPGQPKNVLSYEHINDIEQDAQGCMWIATWNGLNILNPANDSLTVFSPDLDSIRQKETNIASALVWDTFIDQHQRVWLALDGRDLCLYDQQKDEFIYFPWRAYVEKQSPYKSNYKSIQKIVRKSEDELWLGTTFGLYSFNSRTQKFSYYGGDTGTDFVSIYVDTLQSKIYFAQKELYCYDSTQKALAKIRVANTEQFTKNTKGSILLPAARGVWIVDKSLRIAYPFSTDSKNLFSLHHDKVSCVYYSENLLWLGSSGGVQVYNLQSDLFPFIEVFPDTLQLDAGNVYSVLEDEDEHQYYISSYTQNSLIIMNTQTRTREAVRSIQNKTIKNCTKIYKDSKKRIWVLSEHAIFYKDNHSKQFVVFDKINPKTRYSFMDMIEDEEGNFWFVSLNAGVFYFQPKLNSFRLLTHEADDLFVSRPTGIAADTLHHMIWISDYGFGVFRYDLRKKKFFFYGTDTSDPKSMRSTLVTDVTVDKNGHAWFATTTGGASKYSAGCDCFMNYSMNNGLPENSLHSIFANASGSIWLTSEKGITRMDTLGRILHQYDVSEGLPHHSFSTPISTNAKGELLIGVKNGFIKFHPDSLQLRARPFPVVFTSIKQGEKRYEDKLENEFNYFENEFTFTFSALTYQRTKDVVYVTKLEGYETDWKNLGNNHSAHYTNIQAGTYTFSVKAFDYTHQQSTNVASFTFIVHPPFWKRTWFITLIISMVVTGVALIIRRLLKKLRTQQIITGVATDLYEQRSLEGVFRIVSQSCIKKLNFSTCHIVQTMSEENNDELTELVKFLRTIKKATIIRSGQTAHYLFPPNSNRTVSCLAVPVFVEGKILAVIYSEHAKRNFFNTWQLKTVEEMAGICSVKMGRYFAEENIRSKVARDLHDDIGSTLSSINIMSQLAIREQGNGSQHLNKIAENSLKMMENMSDIVWSINPKNDSLEQVVFKMKEFAAEILEPKNIEYAFNIENDIQALKLDVEKRKNIFLIFKEAVNNAAKYSDGTKLTVSLAVRRSSLLLSVEDNGKGFEFQGKTSGNGLKNMEDRAHSMNGKMVQTSRPGTGTVIQLEVPLT
jgi:signal transduction histidine kinase/ligand-binding sensor domain-containing protein